MNKSDVKKAARSFGEKLMRLALEDFYTRIQGDEISEEIEDGLWSVNEVADVFSSCIDDNFHEALDELRGDGGE